MFLAVDIGNTNVKLGLYKKNDWSQIYRIESSREAPPEFFRKEINEFLENASVRSEDVLRIVVSSVVPTIKESLQEILDELFSAKLTWLGPEIYSLLGIKIPKPDEIGTDLVANAMAAHKRYKKNTIIIDFGTALTFTTLSKTGEILGVSIAPGLNTAVRALFTNAAQLPEVPLEFPESVIGKDTIHAIQSGILVGYVGLVRHMIGAIRAEMNQDFMVVATGGLSKVLTPLEADFDVVDRELTLDGLRFIGALV